MSASEARNQEIFTYPESDQFLYEALARYPPLGKSVLVIGAFFPCYEAAALAYGAAQVHTLAPS